MTGVVYSLAGVASASYAHERAVEEAIVLVGLAGGTFPSDEMFIKKISVQIMDRVITFAIHARRAAEITNADKIQIGESKWNISDGPQLECNFWTIVNKILHARDIKVATFVHGSTMFTNLGDRIVGYIEVQSDQGKPIFFCPYGLVYAYLSQIPKHP